MMNIEVPNFKEFAFLERERILAEADLEYKELQEKIPQILETIIHAIKKDVIELAEDLLVTPDLGGVVEHLLGRGDQIFSLKVARDDQGLNKFLQDFCNEELVSQFAVELKEQGIALSFSIQRTGEEKDDLQLHYYAGSPNEESRMRIYSTDDCILIYDNF